MRCHKQQMLKMDRFRHICSPDFKPDLTGCF